MGPSSAGALGPMQFLPSTWREYGVDGNEDGVAKIMDPEDAIPAAAAYLKDGGAPEDWYAALYTYNHDGRYVRKVLGVTKGYLRRTWFLALGSILLLSWLVGCGGGQQEKSSELTVLAAASLTDAFRELATTFEERNPGTEVQTSFAGSSELLTQIRHGASADVFASADERNMNTALKEG